MYLRDGGVMLPNRFSFGDQAPKAEEKSAWPARAAIFAVAIVLLALALRALDPGLFRF
jgi:hypothetical protein